MAIAFAKRAISSSPAISWTLPTLWSTVRCQCLSL